MIRRYAAAVNGTAPSLSPDVVFEEAEEEEIDVGELEAAKAKLDAKQIRELRRNISEDSEKEAIKSSLSAAIKEMPTENSFRAEVSVRQILICADATILAAEPGSPAARATAESHVRTFLGAHGVQIIPKSIHFHAVREDVMLRLRVVRREHFDTVLKVHLNDAAFVQPDRVPARFRRYAMKDSTSDPGCLSVSYMPMDMTHFQLAERLEQAAVSALHASAQAAHSPHLAEAMLATRPSLVSDVDIRFARRKRATELNNAYATFVVPPVIKAKLLGMHPWPEAGEPLQIIDGNNKPLAADASTAITAINVATTVNLGDPKLVKNLKNIGVVVVIRQRKAADEKEILRSLGITDALIEAHLFNSGMPNPIWTVREWERSHYVQLVFRADIAPLALPHLLGAERDLTEAPAGTAVLPAVCRPAMCRPDHLLFGLLRVVPYEFTMCGRCTEASPESQAMANLYVTRGLSLKHDTHTNKGRVCTPRYRGNKDERDAQTQAKRALAAPSRESTDQRARREKAAQDTADFVDGLAAYAGIPSQALLAAASTSAQRNAKRMKKKIE